MISLPLALTLVIIGAYGPFAQSNAQPPSASPSAQESQSDRTLEKQVEERDKLLIEYQLSEKVEARVVNNLKTYGILLGFVLAVIGFIGFTVILDVISRRVEKDIKNDIEKDIESFRTRIKTSLVDLHISVAESKQISERARVRLDELKQSYGELVDLSARYERLHNEVRQVTERVEEALTVAVEADRKTDTLRNAVADSFAGRPAILLHSFSWVRDGTIDGSGFGDVEGKIYLRLLGGIQLPRSGILEPKAEMAEIEIQGELIDVWKEDHLEFHIPDGYIAQINEFQEDVKSRCKDLTGELAFRYNYRVVTSDGRISENSDKENIS